MNVIMEHVFFKPWIGKNYQIGGIFGKKILVLGEGHVCDGCEQCGLKYAPFCEEMDTTKTVQFYIDSNFSDEIEKGGWFNTYKKFERSLVNKETTPEDSKEIWESISFFNYPQVAIPSSRMAGTSKQYKESADAMYEVLEELQPDIMIVWGMQLFHHTPNERWTTGEELVYDGYEVKNGYYQLLNKKQTRVIVVYHPSAGYSWDWWYKVIRNEIDK
jgi:hypothetical protein